VFGRDLEGELSGFISRERKEETVAAPSPTADFRKFSRWDSGSHNIPVKKKTGGEMKFSSRVEVWVMAPKNFRSREAH